MRKLLCALALAIGVTAVIPAAQAREVVVVKRHHHRHHYRHRNVVIERR
ncbi:MAG: hypothetical protein JO336_00975 [Acidobacteriia bacterium]|nr:hypothetical protein [Terriglobia bacterium]